MKRCQCETVLLLLLCDDLPHSTGKVRGSTVLEFPSWGEKKIQCYLSAFYLQTLDNKSEAFFQDKDKNTWLISASRQSFPCDETSRLLLSVRSQPRLTPGNGRMFTKHFSLYLFWKSARLEERCAEWLYRVLIPDFMKINDYRRMWIRAEKQNANVPPQISYAGSGGAGGRVWSHRRFMMF